MLRIFVIALLLASLAAPAAEAETNFEFLHGLGDTRYHAIHSDHIGRPFHIYVMMPEGYDANAADNYPVIFLLDGGALYPMLVPYYRVLQFGEDIPHSIIVGISYGSDNYENGNFRSADYTAPSDERDYWGGAAKFQKFLEHELFPLIETHYRANPERRIIFGQSIGGQFVLFTALTRPALFWGHIASNPALHRNLPFFLKYHGEVLEHEIASSLFVGSATHDNPRFRTPALEWIRHWRAVPDKPWRLKVTYLEGHSHMSAPPAAFRDGMHWLFSE